MTDVTKAWTQGPRVAVILLHQNTEAATDALARHLLEGVRYEDKQVFVIDNGSARAGRSTTHRLGQPVGFAEAMYEGWLSARRAGTFDAFWLVTPAAEPAAGGADLLGHLVEVLFADPARAQIAAQQNSAHACMEHAAGEADEVPYLEPTATLVKATTFETVGFWDLQLTQGWGVDYDFGYRVRQAGLKNIVTNRARIAQRDPGGVADYGEFRRAASAEMHAVLGAKYGRPWAWITKLPVSPLPVILSCDRTPDILARFVASFNSVRRALAPPLVIVDSSGSPRLSARYLGLLAELAPRAVVLHPPQPGLSCYDSVQHAAAFALATGRAELGPGQALLFLEDDVVFSTKFGAALREVPLTDDVGFVTLYQPGSGYGAREVNPEHFYGTQCVLFPKSAVELLVAGEEDMRTRLRPGYDLRWSRYLAEHQRRLCTTERSYVQHLGARSRLHPGQGSHDSACFVP